MEAKLMHSMESSDELPYIFRKNLSDFTSKTLDDNALFLQVSWKILEENVWSCNKILQEMSESWKTLEENAWSWNRLEIPRTIPEESHSEIVELL